MFVLWNRGTAKMKHRHFNTLYPRRRKFTLASHVTIMDIVKLAGAAVAAGTLAAALLNAYDRHQIRKAALAALPAGYEFPNCDTVRARGLAPLQSYEPGYSSRMDGDGDGIACEPYN